MSEIKSDKSRMKLIVIAIAAIVVVAIAVFIGFKMKKESDRMDWIVHEFTYKAVPKFYTAEDAEKEWADGLANGYWPTVYPEMKDKRSFEKKLHQRIVELGQEGDIKLLGITAKRLELAGYQNENIKAALDESFNLCIDAELEGSFFAFTEMINNLEITENLSFYSNRAELLSAETIYEVMLPIKETAIASGEIEDWMRYASRVDDVIHIVDYVQVSDFLSADELLAAIEGNLEPAVIESGRGGHYDERQEEHQNSRRASDVSVAGGIREVVNSSYEFYGDFMTHSRTETFNDTTGEMDSLGQAHLAKADSSRRELYYKDKEVGGHDKFMVFMKKDMRDRIQAVYANEKYVVFITDAGIFCVAGTGVDLHYAFSAEQVAQIVDQYENALR